MMTHMSADYRS